jgi:hypothetical protein
MITVIYLLTLCLITGLLLSGIFILAVGMIKVGQKDTTGKVYNWFRTNKQYEGR